MTHNELLAELDEIIKDFCARYDNSNPYYKALRAVVELHKPWPGGCSHCINIEGGYMSYPCPTIQAIEKELM